MSITGAGYLGPSIARLYAKLIELIIALVKARRKPREPDLNL